MLKTKLLQRRWSKLRDQQQGKSDTKSKRVNHGGSTVREGKEGGSPYREGPTPGGAFDIKDATSSTLGLKPGKRCAFQKIREEFEETLFVLMGRQI